MFFEMDQPRPIFDCIQSFQSNSTIIYNKFMWEMCIKYPVPGFKLTTSRLWVSSPNHLTRAPSRLLNVYSKSMCKGIRHFDLNSRPLKDESPPRPIDQEPMS